MATWASPAGQPEEKTGRAVRESAPSGLAHIKLRQSDIAGRPIELKAVTAGTLAITLCSAETCGPRKREPDLKQRARRTRLLIGRALKNLKRSLDMFLLSAGGRKC
ncbi:hypothetical protein CISG_00490 [Coccidioides immitis RMSCC 3703]|uniref:Uncharacterized protein n=1 Tax=Coccidioides immitis RMSCC 3703 TaxID=454286 RepID=A0A0J8QI99_COCIT|nr:hypothetical protein CISG_00490 [Coccidioides immitis RMSCC 3703]